jgi:hypothetical protein
LSMNRETMRLIITWEWEKFPQRWCLESWRMTRNNVGFTFHLIFYTMQRCLIESLLVMKHVFSIRAGNKTPEHAVENKEFTSTKKKKDACLSHSSRPCLRISSITRG